MHKKVKELLTIIRNLYYETNCERYHIRDIINRLTLHYGFDNRQRKPRLEFLEHQRVLRRSESNPLVYELDLEQLGTLLDDKQLIEEAQKIKEKKEALQSEVIRE